MKETFFFLKIRPIHSVEPSVTNYPLTYLHITEEKLGCLYLFENLKVNVTAEILGLIGWLRSF